MMGVPKPLEWFSGYAVGLKTGVILNIAVNPQTFKIKKLIGVVTLASFAAGVLITSVAWGLVWQIIT